MARTVSSLSEAIEQVYQGFILRDLLGFVLPGSLSLLSLAYHLFRLWFPSLDFFHKLKESVTEIVTATGAPIFGLVVLAAFVGFSYVTAWILQSVHYGLVDWIFQFVRGDKRFRFRLWPLTGVFFYAGAVVQSSSEIDMKGELPLSPSMITRGALAPDQALMNIKGQDLPERMREASSYTERISALMLMTGNTAIAGALLLSVVLRQENLGWNWWVFLIGSLVILFVYLEHWRLWYARNLRHRIYVDAAD